MEQQKFFFDKDVVARRDDLLKMPLDALPADELKGYGGSALQHADWAARLDQVDWQILLKLKADGIGTLIPDVQQMRLLASALKVRFRAEVAQRRFDNALRTAQTLFAMSRHLGQHPTFVGNLVGIAVAAQATVSLEEMLGQPGCPNLYWALTYLPSPLIPLEVAAQGERLWLAPTFSVVDDNMPMSGEQLNDVITHFDRLVDGDKRLPEGSLRRAFDVRIRDDAALAAARGRLAAGGIAQERLMTFPAEQVLLLDEKRACLERHDDVIKLVHLPAWEVSELVAEIRSTGPILLDLAPAIEKVRWAQARLEQRIALLRHVEALRLYAAEHGELPAKLSEIIVPLPDDPFSGHPFRYEVVGTTAHLRGMAPKSEENNPAFNLHYEVTLRK
jgi:hypothetical protein